VSWTYDETLLATSELFQVRLKLGDTDTSDQQFQDEEIQRFLTEAGSVDGAVQRAARALASKYSRNVDKWVGDLKILASQRARAYRELAESLTGTASTHRVPSAGGIYVSEKEDIAANEDLVAPSFIRDQFDNVEE
jgi:hypothetical protein